MSVNIPGLIAVIVFYIVILVTGIWASRKSRKEEKKCTGNRSEVTMVGGRNIHVFIGIFTMTATWVGGGYIIGTAEAVYVPTQGLIWALGPLAYVINFVVGGIFFAKPMRSKQYVTMMDPFQQKYGNTVTSFLIIPAFIGDLLWVACVLSALGGTMSVILDISSIHSILISALVAIVYTLLGGLYSVAYTDVIQLTTMLISLGLCIPFVMKNPASTDIRFTAVHELFQAPWIGKLELSDAGKWIDDLLIFHLCPPFISIAGIGAIAAAVMSSVDSAMLSSASLFARNIYKNILRKTASDNEVVWVVRVSVLVVGLCGTGLAVTADTVYGFWLISGDVIYTVLFSQLICVLYFPSTNSYGAAAGFVVGAVLRLLGGEPVLGIPPVIYFPYCRLIDGVYVQYFPFKTLVMLLSLITIMLGSFLASVLFNRGLLPERWDVFQVKKHNDKILRRSHYEETCLDDTLAVNEDSPVEKES
ncbi:high-affinity choline transporter 1-like isoform X3 [Lepisosteus oculatus]|uniref:high-affinity choline transporter 1-like isoform X3 n=1 Tax=Lepisosteus oculatus TaxID=7918 RepID=UPI0037233F3C